ncbi:retrovirus-related Pol polyprotein from transposon TNT 1-94 [Trichonephila clavipes]|uniref:Retrovirus-related Pol polyprotein from transposon TNT 1-94 n=1 Tax=Trichonephila clavipes TaxID=2585209 RepID=A0A8X6SUF4_TRICX|nr:retrovirus-related Pol polyprotein from transposon TNT 1-94 [Trichonephila clavipes]
MNSVASTLNRVTDMEFNNQISVLTPNNWNTWKHDMQVLLMHYGCWQFIVQTKPEQPDEETTYKEKLDLQLHQFFGTKYQPGEDVGIFISRVKTAATRLQEAGHKLDDLYIGFQLIRWLPQEFQSTVQQIYRWKEEDFGVVKIEAELILEANRLQLMKQDLEKAENAYLSSFTSKKSKTLPGATAAAHGDQMARMITKEKCKNDSVNGLPRLTDNGKTRCIPCKLAKSKESFIQKDGGQKIIPNQGFSDLSEQQEALMVEVTIPNCYKQAIRYRDASKWHDAMDKEINVMKERKVWDLVDHPDNIKILKNRWVYTIKYDENNKIVRYKARLVARDTVIYMKQPTGYEIDNNKVYDIIIFGKEMENVNFVLQLLQKNFDLKIMGKTKKLLGIEFEEIGNSLFIHQRSYIQRLCEIYEKYKYPVSSLPISKGQVLSKLDSPKTSEEILTVPYRNLIGSLSFIAIRTRPDIMYAVNVLSQFQANPGIKHWNCLLRLLGYLKYTQEYKLELSKVKSLKLRCYSDSDFATNRDDRVSMGGFITFIDETPISWRTFKQKSVSLSTMEAEYVSLTEAANEFIWLKNVIDNKSLNLELSENVMFCDNQAAISFSKSPVENYRTKHIDVRYHFLKEFDIRQGLSQVPGLQRSLQDLGRPKEQHPSQN